MIDLTTTFITNLQKNYDRVVNYFGTGQSQRFVVSLACHFTLENKQFSGVLLNKVMDKIITESKSLPLQYESAISYKIALKLMNTENLEESIVQLNERDRVLQKNGFKKSPSRVIGGLFLQGDITLHAKRAKMLFDAMNQRQRFLTTNEDIPYVVIMTVEENQNPSLRADTIVRYYQGLKSQNFILGNHLQALSQIMTIYSEEYNEILLNYVIQLRNVLLNRNVKVRRIHYPFIGILALASTNEEKIEEMVELYNLLIKLKPFRMEKELALIVAIQKTIRDLSYIQSAVDMGPLSNFDKLLFTADFVLEILSNASGGFGVVFDLFQ